MRTFIIGTAVLATTASLAACSGNDSSRDVTAIEAELGETVESGGRVVSVSPQGVVLATVDDETCTFDLDGTERDCWALELRLDQTSLVSWSPDGARFAVADGSVFARLQDADIAVVDIESGDTDVLTDDGTDDPVDGDIDLAPLWVDDDTIMFLRAPAGDEGLAERDVELVRLDLDEDAEPQVHDTEAPIFAHGAAAIAGDMLLSASPIGDDASVIRIDEEGDADTVVSVDRASERLFVNAGADGEAAVVSGIDVAELTSLRTTYVRGDDDPIESSFEAAIATVDPAGRLVAAQQFEAGGGAGRRSSLVLWDPDSDDTNVLDLDDDTPLGVDLTWTEDDRIVIQTFDGWVVVDITDE